MKRAQMEIVGYHVVGPEDDHFAAVGRSDAVWLAKLVRAAGGESVEWGVLEAHERAADGTDLDVFADYLATVLPAVKRYRLTLEIFDVEAGATPKEISR